ncbi:hypothetical protein GTH32_13575 [Alteromonas sp. 345S023]|uniref:ATP-grasp domain-containing protein n=1 Tax=Alteromonas profundi TaxID=2696062 RepID=A0A7X5RLY9_9ALTE|nr:hypothetical protein [Alteromonas profundi]NDV92206.1 hypothetical protein [Alteromonas profundi]
MYIALLGSENEPQIIHLMQALQAQGQQTVVVNTQHFGERWQLSYDPDFNDGILHFGPASAILAVPTVERLAMSQISAVYWHQYLPPTCKGEDDAHTQWLTQEITSTLLCWFNFSETRWVNSIAAIRAHQCKPTQMRAAAKIGANIPYTFVGNCEQVAYQFCCNMREVIYKPVKGGKTTQFLQKHRHLRRHLSQFLATQPVTFQAYIEGTNIRSYVLGNEVISIQIDSDSVDFRDDESAQPCLTLLPKNMQDLALAICRELGMYWCAIDWRKTAKGKYYFLEANPCPFFLHVENVTGVDITGRLIKLLT